MTYARSLLFAALFYLWSLALVNLCLPVLLAPRSWLTAAFRFWARGVVVLLRVCCDIRVEVRGREHVPTGRALVAAKHQCMFDVFAQFVTLPDACFVMRKELAWIPYFGWYAWKGRMIVIDREGGTSALRQMVRDGKDRLAEERQILIFPPATISRAWRGSTATSACRRTSWPPTPASTGRRTGSCGGRERSCSSSCRRCRPA